MTTVPEQCHVFYASTRDSTGHGCMCMNYIALLSNGIYVESENELQFHYHLCIGWASNRENKEAQSRSGVQTTTPARVASRDHHWTEVCTVAAIVTWCIWHLVHSSCLCVSGTISYFKQRSGRVGKEVAGCWAQEWVCWEGLWHEEQGEHSSSAEWASLGIQSFAIPSSCRGVPAWTPWLLPHKMLNSEHIPQTLSIQWRAGGQV